MSYRVKKSINQYSLVDLLEISMFKQHPEYDLVKKELYSRSPSQKEIEIAQKGLKYRMKARNKPLSTIDKVYCLLAPVMVSKPTISGYSDVNDLYSDQLDEYQSLNETKSVIELKKWQKIGRRFQIVLLSLILLILCYYKFLK